MQFKILSIIKHNREDMVLADPPSESNSHRKAYSADRISRIFEFQ